MRSIDTEENKQFVEQIGRGIVPRELRDRAQNQDVDVSVVDKRSESFDPGPQPSYVAFSGEGQRLRCAKAAGVGPLTDRAHRSPLAFPSGGPSAAAASAAVAGNAAGPYEVQLDESQPKSPVQIRTHDGRRLRQQFNPTHTVADLQRYVQRCGGKGLCKRGASALTRAPSQRRAVGSPVFAGGRVPAQAAVGRVRHAQGRQRAGQRGDAAPPVVAGEGRSRGLRWGVGVPVVAAYGVRWRAITAEAVRKTVARTWRL